MANAMYRFKPDNRKRLISAISKGATYILACNYAGISYNTFLSWMRKGEQQLENEEEGNEYLKFYCEVKKAEGIAVTSWLTLIEQAAKNGNWQAAAWKLERRYPNEYGRYTPEKPDNKDQPDDSTIEERIARVVSIVDDARKRNSSKRSGNDSSQGNDST